MAILAHSHNVLSTYKGFLKAPKETKPKMFMGVELELAYAESGHSGELERWQARWVDDHYDMHGILVRRVLPGAPPEPTPEGCLSCAKLIQRVEVATKNFAILKSDSSIDPDGFELVTVPATLLYHKRTWPKLLGTNSLLNKYMEGNESCGMHVHCSKNMISDVALQRLLFFMHFSNNFTFLEKIAGRDFINNEYVGDGCEAFNKMPTLDAVKHLKGGAYRGIQNYHYEKYMPLNPSSPKTVEFRIFQSTTNWRRILANLEFCYSLIAYCHLTGDPNYETYKTWVTRSARPFPYLKALLKK